MTKKLRIPAELLCVLLTNALVLLQNIFNDYRTSQVVATQAPSDIKHQVRSSEASNYATPA